MRKRRITWQLYFSYLLVIFISLIAVTLYASRSLRKFYLDQVEKDLAARAYLVEDQFFNKFIESKKDEINPLTRQLGREAATRITVILPDGRVLGDSKEDPKRMDNHRDRPEVLEALRGRVGNSMRYSHTLKENFMYVALPLKVDNRILGVVRTAIPVTSVDQELRKVYGKIVFGGFVIAGFAAFLSLIFSRRISRPLVEMKQIAECFARGDFEQRLPVPNSEEIGSLAEAMNQMAAQLGERIRTIVRQRNEQEAVLASMVEGVFAVDNDEHILFINQAGAELFEIVDSHILGRKIQELVRDSELQKFVKRALLSEKPIEADLSFQRKKEMFLQAHGTSLRDAQGKGIGALIVLNDVTRLRRLESLRRDFVANVSHELKTPITSIKGFVETLLEGKVQSSSDKERFLGIVAGQADRLNAIVEDLLSLSRIEQEEEKGEISLELGPLSGVLQSACQSCEIQAKAKGVQLIMDIDDEISVSMDPVLLEQAVINLIDNAIKYSESGTKVEISAQEAANELLIQVEDRGCGIPAEHLPRLFERFYRVDKARSRKLGGTGLGLAIAKHIVQLHGGRVTVTSISGEGSVFSIHLPLGRKIRQKNQ